MLLSFEEIYIKQYLQNFKFKEESLLKKHILINSSIISTILFLNPIACHAEWIQDSTGWWYSNQSSWAIGWQMINEKWYYFDNNGYMQIGWIQTDGKWYYMYEDGSMAKDTLINGYKLGSDGAWIESDNNNNTTKVSISGNGKLSDISGINFSDINKIIFYDGRGGLNQPLTINDKEKINSFISILNSIEVESSTINDNSTGWIYKACLYTNTNKILEITFTDPLCINGKYYNITKGNLNCEDVGNFLKSVEPSYITNL